MRLQPFSSKNLRYFSRISAVVMYFILVNSPFHLVRGPHRLPFRLFARTRAGGALFPFMKPPGRQNRAAATHMRRIV